MTEIIGASPIVFLGLTVILFGGCALMTGRAMANTWRPMWQIVPYSLLLGMGCRYMTFALFEGELLQFSGFLVSTTVMLVIAAATYRIVKSRRMVSQYPWIYASKGLFAWREIAPDENPK